MSSLLAMITLGIPGHCNDIDPEVIKLGEWRARHLLDFIIKKDGSYPKGGIRRSKETDHICPYDWLHKTPLAHGPRKAVATDVFTVPATTTPHGMPNYMKDLANTNGMLLHYGLQISISADSEYIVTSLVPRAVGSEILLGVWGRYMKRLPDVGIKGQCFQVISLSLSLSLSLCRSRSLSLSLYIYIYIYIYIYNDDVVYSDPIDARIEHGSTLHDSQPRLSSLSGH
jgi:hypothetical protein